MRMVRWLSVVAILAVSACGRGDARPGRAVEKLGLDYAIVGVTFDPATYHWAVPSELLTTAEGAGPRTLNISVSAEVLPHISFTGTHSPSHTDISEALGYDVGTAFQLLADSTVLVPVQSYARVDAYPTYQKATWTMVGLGGVILGVGATYKPIGVYFSTCGCIGISPCNGSCASGFPNGDLPSSSSPAGTGTGGGNGGTGGGAVADAGADAGEDAGADAGKGADGG